MTLSSQDILDFWFIELAENQWYKNDPDLDAEIASRFGETHRAAAASELWDWRSTLTGRLAEVIVLDQFSRNIFRDDARAFAADPMALVLAQEAIANCDVTELAPTRRSFLYMPFMHSESLVIHEQAVQLFSEQGMDGNLEYERRHKKNHR